MSNNNNNNNDEPISTSKNSNIKDENDEKKEMKEKEATAEDFTSRKYLRSLSTIEELMSEIEILGSQIPVGDQ